MFPAMYIPYYHDRVMRKATATVCLVVLVDIHNRTVDLFPLRGAGELIRGRSVLRCGPSEWEWHPQDRIESPTSPQICTAWLLC